MTDYLVVNRGALLDVLVADNGDVHMSFQSYSFKNSSLADAAFAEMTSKHPGWPLERVDVDE